MNPSHRRAQLPTHGTKGRCAEREKEEGYYSTMRGEERGEDKWGEDSGGSLGDGSNVSGASTSRDDKSLGGGRGRNDGGRGGQRRMATGDTAPKEAQGTQGKGKEEGGTGAADR